VGVSPSSGNTGQSGHLAALYEAVYSLFFVAFKRRHPVRDPGLFSEVQAIGFSILDPMQRMPTACSWCTTPIVLWLHTGLFDFDCRDRPGGGGVRADGRIELGGHAALRESG